MVNWLQVRRTLFRRVTDLKQRRLVLLLSWMVR